MASVVQKYMKAIRLYGWKDTLAKMYSVRDSAVDGWVGGWMDICAAPFVQPSWASSEPGPPSPVSWCSLGSDLTDACYTDDAIHFSIRWGR